MQRARVFLIFSLGVLSGCAALTDYSVGRAANQTLTPCPPSPRCVSSQAIDPDQRVEPIMLLDASDAVWKRVVDILSQQPRTRVMVAEAHYAHAEVDSPWGIYIDDFELLRDPRSSEVNLRSSSRVGYYDFNVNRERVEALRQVLTDAGLLSAEPQVSPSASMR